jgi:hypothetical protein
MQRRPHRLNVFLAAPALAFMACPAAVRGQNPDSGDPFDEGDPFVVAGALGSGAVPTDVPPEIAIERVAIRALGADSLAEVVAAFTPQSRSRRGGEDEPILLLNGRRIADRREIDELPPEAILRMEIFPEEVALQYGYPPDRRMVNVILRPRYSAILLQARFELPLGDGRATYGAKAGLLRQSPAGRVNIDASYRRQDAVTHEASGTGAAERWRLPRTDRFTLNGTYAREPGPLSVTANATGRRELKDWKLGSGTGGSALRRRDREDRAGFALTLAGKQQGWNWTASTTFDWQADRADAQDGSGPATIAGYGMRGTRREAELDLTASGPVGRLLATLAAGGSLRHGETRDLLPGAADAAIDQDTAYVSGSVDFPLAAGDAAVLFGEGKLIRARGAGTLTRHGIGLRGSPAAGLSFSASYSDEQALPDFADLADLPPLTPNTLIYDFGTGGSVYAGQLEGGNPALQPSSTRTLALRAQYQPFPTRDLALTAEFTDLSIRNGVSEPLGPTPQVEAAFSQRFLRDGRGVLTAFDSRPLNLARQDRSVLRWGANWTEPLEPGAQVQLAAFHSWTLKDDAVLRAGLPEIDLLDGGGIGTLGGTSRHRIELQLAYASPDAGVRLTGDWSSPTMVAGSAHRLRFRPGFDLGLRLFLNLKSLRDRLGDWATGRIYLSFDNFLGGRTRITDEAGRTVDFYRGDEEESGRTVRLSFRKFFY